MKIFATDLDGTLLKENSKIDSEIINSIKDLIDSGYRIIPVSGRISSSIRYFMKKLNIEDFLIGNNGAIILDKNNNIVKDWPLEKNALFKIIELANKYDINIRMYSKDTYYSRKLDIKEIAHMYIGDNQYAVNINIRDDIYDYILDSDTKLYKIILKTKQDNYEKFFNELKTIENIEYTFSGKINLDIMAKNVTKSRALNYLLELLKKDENIEKIVSVGDYYNDIDMIKISDLGIAMGNSCQELKNVADFITSKNTEDGFSEAVKFVLKNNS